MLHYERGKLMKTLSSFLVAIFLSIPNSVFALDEDWDNSSAEGDDTRRLTLDLSLPKKELKYSDIYDVEELTLTNVTSQKFAIVKKDIKDALESGTLKEISYSYASDLVKFPKSVDDFMYEVASSNTAVVERWGTKTWLGKEMLPLIADAANAQTRKNWRDQELAEIADQEEQEEARREEEEEEYSGMRPEEVLFMKGFNGELGGSDNDEDENSDVQMSESEED